MQLLTIALIPLLAPAGHHEAALQIANLAFIPPAMLGTCVGMALFRQLDDRQFARAMNALLLVSGLGLAL